MSKKKIELNTLIEIGPNFWNIRGSFVIKMLIDIDAIPITEKLRKEIDDLTANGSKIEAVLATHPFHTLALPAFYSIYPNAAYYGCPRHLRNLTNVKWAGDLNDCKTRSLWEPEIEMRIPAGSEFVSPVPESNNHFSSVFVFHKASRTIHVDDTIFYCQDPGTLLSLAGYKKGSMMFHPSITGPGLLPSPDAPYQFRDWINGIITDWDFDNIVTAHIGYRVGGAKAQLQETLTNADPLFKKLTEKRHKKAEADLPGEAPTLTSKENNECG